MDSKILEKCEALYATQGCIYTDQVFDLLDDMSLMDLDSLFLALDKKNIPVVDPNISAQDSSKPEKKKKHTSGNCDHQEDCDELARRIAVRVNEIYSDDYKAIVARNSIYSDVISHYWLNKAFDKSDLQSQIRRFKTGDSAIVSKIVDKYILRILRLSYTVYLRSEADFEELVDCGICAIFDSCLAYNESVDGVFSKYCWRNIDTAINQIENGAHLLKCSDIHPLAPYCQCLEILNGANSTEDSFIPITPERSYYDDEFGEESCLLSDEGQFVEKMDELVDASFAKDIIAAILPNINPRLQEVITMRYGLKDGFPLTLEDVGERLELTRERIRQLENKALIKLSFQIKKSKRGNFFKEVAPSQNKGSIRATSPVSSKETEDQQKKHKQRKPSIAVSDLSVGQSNTPGTINNNRWSYLQYVNELKPGMRIKLSQSNEQGQIEYIDMNKNFIAVKMDYGALIEYRIDYAVKKKRLMIIS